MNTTVKKKEDKKRLIKRIIICLVIVVVTAFSLFKASHRYYYKYNDWWIVGKQYDEIINEYGEFDLRFGNTFGYEINESFGDSIWRHFMGGAPNNYYYIKFNENKIAQEVYKGSYPGY